MRRPSTLISAQSFSPSREDHSTGHHSAFMLLAGREEKLLKFLKVIHRELGSDEG